MQLPQGLEQLKLDLPEAAQQQLKDYIQLLLKWNRAYNLIAATGPEDLLAHHIFDSLAIVPYVTGQRVLDLGTGAGLPGIPLAIALPDQHFVLLDSIGKKTRFLTQTINALKLTNVTVIQARIEAFFPEQCFNTVVTRAVGTTQEIMRMTQHVLCPHGHWLLMKGLYPEEELKDMANPFEVHRLQVPGLNKQRCLVCITGL